MQTSVQKFAKNAIKNQDHSAFPERPTDGIIIEPAKLHENLDAAQKLLVDGKYDVYQRSGKLVCIGRSESRDGTSRSADTGVIKEVDPLYLTELLTRVGRWYRYDNRSQSYKKIDCPEKIAKHLMSRPEHEWTFNTLKGVINAPTLRSDGSIFQTPGYDLQSGLYYMQDEHFDEIPEEPTENDIKKAKDLLLWLLKDFPFDGEASRSVAMAGMLTSMIRKSLPSAPLIGITAPKMASGKSLLADVISLISTGNPMNAVSYTDNEAEEKKRLLALFIGGAPVICYDNVEHPFGSQSLCIALTQQHITDRVLGASKNATVPTNATFLVTGNNLTFLGDVSTRVLLCKLDPNVERPEEREFKVDLRCYIAQNRNKLVKACLIILRVYHVAGRPRQTIKQFGRFEEWSNWVRSAIVWMGMTDPNESRIDIENADPIRAILKNLLTSWHACFEDSPKTIKQVINEIAVQNPTHDQELLFDTFEELAPDGKGGIKIKMLSKKLSLFKNRIEGGNRLEQMGETQGYKLWRVKKI